MAAIWTVPELEYLAKFRIFFIFVYASTHRICRELDALRLFLFLTSSKLRCRSLTIPNDPYRPQQQLLHDNHANVRTKKHRCPPCKAFSPILAQFYNQTFVKNHLEIVFVSSDRDESSFGSYFGGMPWLAMIPAYASQEARSRQMKLADTFKIQVGSMTRIAVVVAVVAFFPWNVIPLAFEFRRPSCVLLIIF